MPIVGDNFIEAYVLEQLLKRPSHLWTSIKNKEHLKTFGKKIIGLEQQNGDWSGQRYCWDPRHEEL